MLCVLLLLVSALTGIHTVYDSMRDDRFEPTDRQSIDRSGRERRHTRVRRPADRCGPTLIRVALGRRAGWDVFDAQWLWPRVHPRIRWAGVKPDHRRCDQAGKDARSPALH